MREIGKKAAAVLILMAASVASGCAGAGARVRQNISDGGGATSSAAKPPKPSIFPDGARLAPDSRIFIKQSYLSASEVEQGNLNGAYFELDRSDGTGRVGMDPGLIGVWSFSTRYDMIDDSLMISAQRRSLMVFFSPDFAIAVFGDTHPGTGVALRINDDPPFRTERGPLFSGEEARRILEGLRPGAVVTTQYTEWPRRTTETDRWEIASAEIEALATIADWIRKNVDTSRIKASSTR